MNRERESRGPLPPRAVAAVGRAYQPQIRAQIVPLPAHWLCRNQPLAKVQA